jgi:hypothetical protein
MIYPKSEEECEEIIEKLAKELPQLDFKVWKLKEDQYLVFFADGEESYDKIMEILTKK